MGKKQHQKDKLWISASEWKYEGGGKKDTPNEKFFRLPFYCCALSLTPFKDPYCTKEGVIFDITNIVPFLKKFGISPATGEKMRLSDLIKLQLHKSNKGEYHCPILFKVFTPTTHIVAVRTSGNVYCYEAIEHLNIKMNNFKDLITDEPFTKSDIITIQNPLDADSYNVYNFFYYKNNMMSNQNDPEASKILKSINSDAAFALSELSKTVITLPKSLAKQTQTCAEDRTGLNDAHYSQGKMSSSFTSTIADVQTENTPAIIDRASLRYEKVKTNGYVRLNTTLGPLNLELYCDKVPQTCENFILLCERKYYENSCFHRLIKNFMIQGGDPTGTGTGGTSAWDKPFNDQFLSTLSHDSRGVLSMANNGLNANQSQFFITFRPCIHLDRKHTIFGRLVGGFQTLSAMEICEVDDEARPKDPIKILSTDIFTNPFQKAEEELMEQEKVKNYKDPEPPTRVVTESLQYILKSSEMPVSEEVGKYLSTSSTKRKAANSETVHKSIKMPKKAGFGDFNNW